MPLSSMGRIESWMRSRSAPGLSMPSDSVLRVSVVYRIRNDQQRRTAEFTREV